MPPRSWCFTTIRRATRSRATKTFALTHRLIAAGVLMGIDVIDHVILGNVRYCSMKEDRYI